MIKAGIIGATGYAGAELVRLLMQHPQAEIAAISSVSFEGKPVSSVYPAYRRLNDMVCTTAQDVIDKSDVVFAALPHGLSQDIAKECYEREKIFIDLGADFRLENEDDYKEWYGGEYKDKELHRNAVYALPELFRDPDKGQKNNSEPRLLYDGRAAGARPRNQRWAYLRQRYCSGLQIRRNGRGQGAVPEHALSRFERRVPPV